jgi:TRAP-type C4-dicarboxylate transport system substrate-binding protein
MVSKKFWDGLSADEKTVLQESCTEARDFQRKFSRETNTKIVEDLKAKGMRLNDVDPQEIARMKEQLQPVVEKHTKNIGEDLVKRTYAEIEKVRTQN